MNAKLSTVIANGTGTQVFKAATPGSQKLYDVQIAKTGGKFIDSTLTGIPVNGDLLVSDGWTQLTYGAQVAGDLTVSCNDSLVALDTLKLTGAASDFSIDNTVKKVTATAAPLKLTGATPTVDIDSTASFGKLVLASTSRPTFTGTAAATFSGATGNGDIVLNQTGSTNFSAPVKIDSTVITAGTATLAGAGDDTAGSIIVTGGDLNITGDSLVVTGNLTGSTAGGITGDSLSVIKMTGSGKRLALFPGDSIPGKIRISGTPIYIDSGGTVAGLWFDTDGTKASFQAGKAYTFSDTLACGGASGSRDSLISQTAGVRDSLRFGGKTLTYRHMYIKDQCVPAATDTLYANDSTSISGGGNKCQ